MNPYQQNPQDPYQQDPYQQNPYHQDPYGQNPQDPYQQNPYQQPQRYKEPGSSGMAVASVILGVCSFIFVISGLSPLLGGLGILLALLSRGSGKMSVTGRAGLIASIFGLVIGTGILIFLTAFLLQNTTIDQQYEQIDRYYREYSDDYDDDYYDDYNNFLDEFGDGYDDYFSPGDGWYRTPDTSPDSGTII